MIVVTISAVSAAGFSSISDIVATIASAEDLVAGIAIRAIPVGPDPVITFMIAVPWQGGNRSCRLPKSQRDARGFGGVLAGVCSAKAQAPQRAPRTSAAPSSSGSASGSLSR